MFQNTFQNGNFFQLYDPKISQDKLKNIYKLTNVHGNNKIFDKELKTYVLEFATSTSKISFPRQQKKDLYLIQQFLICQIYFFPSMSWNIELVVSDLTKTKRRVIISSNSHKFEIKPFFVKFPCPAINQGVWNNFAIDLYSFINAFKGQTYRSLDAIYITGHFKLRRVYTTNTKPSNGEGENQLQDFKELSFLPKNFYYPPGIQYTSKLVCYEENIMLQNYEPTQSSTKNGSNLKSRLKVETPNMDVTKSQKKVGYKNEKKFLANTNGPETLNRNKKRDLDSSQKSEQTQKNIKTPMSTDKNIKNRKSLGKNYIPKKQRSSIEKKVTKKEDKGKGKGKLNPWRGGKNTEGSQMSISKIENERNIESAQTTLFKTKNNLANKFNESKNKGFDRKSDHYSDSQYIELSQKFSTVTEGKFFKNQLGSQHINEEKHENHQDQIEENIQMETNSMHSNSNRKNEIKNELINQPIEESIIDSLEHLHKGKKISPGKRDMEEMGMSSYYGFGEKMMRKFNGEIERPYSPPIGEREMTEEGTEYNENFGKEEVEVIYDPVLNCYYDHKTHTYYELKN